MKSYNHLWEKFISEENIRLAIKKSSKGKRNRKNVKEIYENQDEWIGRIRDYAINFKHTNHKPIEIYDGISRKKRMIIVPSYKEQIVHHMAVNAMMEMFTHGMYEHSYGSIPKRGAHKGKKYIEKWIRNDRRNVKYCLKMDIRKFFESVPHDILKEKLREKIHDERFLGVLFEIIDSAKYGIPLGFYTSQWLANWYLQGLDHYVKEELRATYYMRYMDDMVIFGSNKKELHMMRKKISEYLAENLGLDMKGNWQVFRFDYIKGIKRNGRVLDFMGFKFFREKTVLRKGIMLKMSRKAKEIFKKGKITIHDARQMMSYLGWIKSADIYGVYCKRVKPYIDFTKLKNRISRHDKGKRADFYGNPLCEIGITQ